MKNPLISIIIPIYNCEKYIRQSIESIFSQSFKNFEIIIINDGSTDNSFNVISNLMQEAPEWLRKHFIFIDRTMNKGCFNTRMEAVRLSNGKYIALHDADDISLPNRLEKQYIYLENTKNIWCVGSTAITIDENSIETGIYDYSPVNHSEIVKSVKRCENPIIDPSTMFRKEVFLELEGYSLKKDRNLVDDFDLWTRAILEGHKFHNFKESLIKYRINDSGNTIKHKKEMIKQHMVVWREFKGKYKG